MEDSFGYRAEKLLRIAEQEAAEVRTHASRESAAIVEQARTEAEKHRHEVEQSLISRAAVLEQQAAQRNAELQEREQQIADQLSAAREQADQLHAAAVRTADRLRQESEAAAEEAKLRAATDIQRQRDQAAQEIARLDKVQTDVRVGAGPAQRRAVERSSPRSAPVRPARGPKPAPRTARRPAVHSPGRTERTTAAGEAGSRGARSRWRAMARADRTVPRRAQI